MMKRISGLSLAAVSIAALGFTASPGLQPAFAQKSALQQYATDPATGIDLQEEDGAALEVLPTGGWRLYARGGAVYGAAGAEELNRAYEVAEANALDNARAFLSQELTDEEAVSELAYKTGYLRADPTIVPPEVIRSTARTFTNRSREVLDNLEVLEREQVPLDSGPGGTVRVTVGVSSEMLGEQQQPETQETF